MELLKALVALGGESVSQEQLGDLLWPDADGDVAAGNFKTTLSRLRKLLGKQDLLVVREGTLSLSREHCWTDVCRFDELVSEIELFAHPGGGGQEPARIEAFVVALHVAYPEPFLCNGREQWLPALRRSFHKRYMRCIDKLADLMESCGSRERAADIRSAAVKSGDEECL